MINELSMHRDPSVFRAGEVEGHAYFIPTSSKRRIARREESDRFISLSGEWLFKWWPSLLDAEEFYAEDFCPDGFTPVSIPECWQSRGVDYIQYESSAYPFIFDPPYPPEVIPCAGYIKKANLHLEEGERYELTLEGKDAAAYVFVNGKFAGYCEAPHSASAFDVTELLKDGENLFCILLLKWCSGSYLDDQDKIRLSGLFRDVYILKRKADGIRDFSITAEADGSLTLKVDSLSLVYAEILDRDELLYSATVCEDGISAFVKDIQPWSAEIPKLYELHLYSAGEHIRHRFGFRTVTIKDGVMLFNGKPIKIYGYNRHDSLPYSGYAMTYEEVRRDLLMMKRYNSNAVRCSHYPNAPYFYEMCDEIGLYVMCEADYESDGCVLQGDANIISSSSAFSDAIVDRNVRMYDSFKNFTSIFSWSLGNESGWGEGLKRAARALRERDKTRLLHYEGVYRVYQEMTDEEKKETDSLLDFFSNMYPTLEAHKALADNPALPLPFIMCEYCHAMGNSSGDARFYDEIINSSDRFTGGFIWEWADHAMIIKDENGMSYYGYGGDFGEHHHRSNVCMDGACDPDRIPHSALYEIAAAFSPVRITVCGRTVRVKNRQYFKDLSDFGFDYLVDLDGETVTEGELAVSAAPGEEITLTLPEIPKLCGRAASLTVRAKLKVSCPYAEADAEISHASLPLEVAKAEYKPEAKCPTLTETVSEYVVNGEGFEYRFRRDSGMLTNMRFQDTELLSSPVSVCSFRAPTDNDNSKISFDANVALKWRARASGDIAYPETLVRDFSCKQDSEKVILSGRFIHAVQGRRYISEGEIGYVIFGDGRIELYQNGGICSHLPYFPPRYGFMLPLNKGATDITYYGYGPYETYEDKLMLSTRGAFSYTPDDPTGRYETPQESGSHAYTEYLKLRIGDVKLDIEGDKFSFCASHYTPAQLADAAHVKDLTPSGALNLHLDYRMSGVGSASCGGQMPVPECRINPGDRFNFRFAITPSIIS